MIYPTTLAVYPRGRRGSGKTERAQAKAALTRLVKKMDKHDRQMRELARKKGLTLD